jgi:hypothetical protein
MAKRHKMDRHHSEKHFSKHAAMTHEQKYASADADAWRYPFGCHAVLCAVDGVLLGGERSFMISAGEIIRLFQCRCGQRVREE